MYRRRFCSSLGAALALSGSPGIADADDGPMVGPIHLVGNRVAMPVRVNQAGTFLFAIDTGGAISLIREDLARTLSLPYGGSLNVGVAGHDGPHETFVIEDATLAGIVRQQNVRLVGVGPTVLGDQIAGALASGILTTVFSELNFDTLQWRVWPNGRPNLAGFTRLDSEITRSEPGRWSPALTAAGTVNGTRLRFLLDTGGLSLVRLNHRAARDLGLWSNDHPFAPLPNGRRIVRLKTMAFAGYVFDGLLALLLSDNREDDISDGLIGLPLLRCFNLACDPAGHVIWARRSGLSPAPFTYPLSGLAATQAGGALRVTAVGKGSPGEQAGIRPDDTILSQAPQATLQALGGPPGSAVSLTISRPSGPFSATVTLRPYL
ncbi:hypothetical protein AA12717_3002 [Gluconacetobacter sacchari DSM 12717]|uniref:Signaling protein n=2 Tax=Gluconacetobacter sacchari TaxID=92759 RepID=A0A7W4ICF0_9PROT|nr:retropepsin-like aspartic protease [Gluconacetobacter sacchari]MBB2160232.1 signaling protein [Gluconacetobacter sacchari]GBQ28589.1 hypothetical protein AA12717_3002 [Gluconacetobacter sacchari DSM 12717]